MQPKPEPPVRHTCTFCGGHSLKDLETVRSPLRTRYRVPADHKLCKRSILSLSLSLSLDEPVGARFHGNEVKEQPHDPDRH